MVHFNLPVLFFKAVINFNGLTGVSVTSLAASCEHKELSKANS